MTLHPYDSEKLENLVFRFFDITAQLREIAKDAKNHELDDIPINDRKALQWCNELELWVKRTRMSLDIALNEKRKK